MNNVTLVGNLTRDPELRFIPNSGTAVTRFSIAVRREFKKEGQPDSDFFNVVVWGKSAENAANYLKKGSKCGVVGQLRNNHYEDKNGVKHYNVEINAQTVEFLDSRKQENTYQPPTERNNPQGNNTQPVNNNQFDQAGFMPIDSDSDIPFAY